MVVLGGEAVSYERGTPVHQVQGARFERASRSQVAEAGQTQQEEADDSSRR